MAERSPEHPKKWAGPTTGRSYDLTKFHMYKGQVVICPACGSRPCEGDCPEQILPDVYRRQQSPEFVRAVSTEERVEYQTKEVAHVQS